jgi:glycosyltransferase involved in cell wall biosynthesis
VDGAAGDQALPGSVRSVSVVVPVHDSAEALRECLAALQASFPRPAEILVVDDASSDETPRVAAAAGARVLRLARNVGPAAARNEGAREARGEILLFVDADVVVPPSAVGQVADLLGARPDVAAVFGSYDTRPRAPGLVSQYRNLLHHFVHQTGRPEASTFWAGCGAIRRAVFEAVGGFDEIRFRRPSIEDIELGYRLRRAGHTVLLDRTLQATHLKRWTLWSTVRTDVLCRAIPWSRLILETGAAPDDLNLRREQRLAGGVVAAGSVGLLLIPWRVELGVIPLAAGIGMVGLNRGLFAFFVRSRGLAFAAACLPLHWLYYLYGGSSYAYVWAEVCIRGRRRGHGPAAAGSGQPGETRATAPPRRRAEGGV